MGYLTQDSQWIRYAKQKTRIRYNGSHVFMDARDDTNAGENMILCYSKYNYHSENEDNEREQFSERQRSLLIGRLWNTLFERMGFVQTEMYDSEDPFSSGEE